MIDAIRRSPVRECRLVAGTDYAITHPEALKLARDEAWRVRLPSRGRGVFHPKLFVAGDRFLSDGSIHDVHAVYVGSGNLTLGGLQSNLECGFLSDERNEDGASYAFKTIWQHSDSLTAARLQEYAGKFAATNRRRSSEELEALGVSDRENVSQLTAIELRNRRPPRYTAIATDVAEAAWAGLQSFTGEFRFQIEFPRAAGEVISRLIGEHRTAGGIVDVLCPDDGQTRPMQYRFYADNSMFRLNVQNDVPNVQWVREHHDGIALVRQNAVPDPPIALTVFRPGEIADEVTRHSFALGTWGRTPTRVYGWF